MTATILAMLTQDGQLSWDSTLGDLLPDTDILPQHISVSVSDLTTHHSGVTDEQLISTLAHSYAWNATEGRQRIAAATLSQPSRYAHGSFKYANANFVIAGLLVDRFTAHAAEQVFEDHPFSALGINDAGFGRLPQPSATSVCQPWPQIAFFGSFGKLVGAVPYCGPVRYRENPKSPNTAGRVYMRGWQYAACLSNILQGAQGREMSQLGLSAESAVALNTAVGNPDKERCRYTFGGWRRCDDDGDSDFILTHDGSNTRYYAHAVVEPGASRTYAAFTNRGDDTAMVEMMSLVKWMRKRTYLHQSVTEQGANDTTTSDSWVEEL